MKALKIAYYVFFFFLNVMDYFILTDTCTRLNLSSEIFTGEKSGVVDIAN